MGKRCKISFLSIKFIFPSLIFVIGACVRLYLFGSIPAGYQMDEAYGAWNALSLYYGGIDSAGYSYPVYFEAWGGGQNALNTYLMLPWIALFGGRMNLYVIRLPQVILSLATLVAVYFLMKKIFDTHIACWSMFLVAICPWHIMVSRWGLESNLAPGFLILGLCFFVYGLDCAPLMTISALCYGLSLYCYATIWPIVPVMLGLQILYCIIHHRLRFSGWMIASAVLLVLLAIPLICFLLVNMGILPSFKIGIFSVYAMTDFRSGELAHSFIEMIDNFKNMIYLFVHQTNVRPYDLIMPYGFFYNPGRCFIVVGILGLLWNFGKSILAKKYEPSVLILIQLFGAGSIGILIHVSMTQINCAYLPMMITGAVGISLCIGLLKKILDRWAQKRAVISACALELCILLCFLYQFRNFTQEYFTSYKELASAYFQAGTDEAVRTACNIADREGRGVVIEDALKYPNVLLALEIPAKEYLQTVTYSDHPPAPACFQSGEVTIQMGIDFDSVCPDNVYLIYMTDIGNFEGWKSIPFGDWFVVYWQEQEF